MPWKIPVISCNFSMHFPFFFNVVICIMYEQMPCSAAAQLELHLMPLQRSSPGRHGQRCCGKGASDARHTAMALCRMCAVLCCAVLCCAVLCCAVLLTASDRGRGRTTPIASPRVRVRGCCAARAPQRRFVQLAAFSRKTRLNCAIFCAKRGENLASCARAETSGGSSSQPLAGRTRIYL
jgi:hypothetical protein